MTKLGTRVRIRYTGDKASAEALRDEWRTRSTKERVYRIIYYNYGAGYGVAVYMI